MRQYLIFSLLTLLSFQTKAQMFDYISTQGGPEKELVIYEDFYLESYKAINVGFDQFETNLRALIKWEVEQYIRVLKEIETDTKNFSPNRREEYKNKKILELSFLLSEKETDLQFQYLEFIEFLNDRNSEANKDVEFKPLMEINGRLQDAAIKVSLEQIDAQNMQEKIKEYTSYGMDAGITLVEMSVFTKGTSAVPGAILLLLSLSTEEGLDLVLPDLESISRIKEWYFINGLCVHARKSYLEQLNYYRITESY